jgi:hypothetical protein
MKLKSFCTTKEIYKFKRLPIEWEKNLFLQYIRQETDHQKRCSKTKHPKNQ